MHSDNNVTPAKSLQAFHLMRMTSTLHPELIRMGIVVLMSVGVGLAVIISTYYVENAKLLIGLIGGLAFVLLTMRWPEFGILSLVALLSGLIRLSWLPGLRLGPISILISDAMLLVLMGLVFLRATAHPGYTLIGSPLILPLCLFIGAFMLSAANAVLIYGVNANVVLRTVRVLILWIVFIPTLQLVRDEQALRRLLIGLLVLSGILLIGVLFPNKLEPLLAVDERATGTGGFTRFYYAGDVILYAMVPVTVASIGIIKEKSQFWRVGLLGLLLYWAFKTYYRQFWLTLFVICVLLLGFLSSQERMRLFKRLVPAAVATMLFVVVLMATQPARVNGMVYAFVERVGSLKQNPLKEDSLQWRVFETRYALLNIGRHPLLGIGLDNKYRPPMESEGDMYSEWAYRFIENGYLYIALFMGLVGLLPFLWLCTAYLLRVLFHQHKIRDDNLRTVYLGFGAAFLGMVACNVATPTFVFGARLVFFPVAMAISEIILRLESEKQVSP